MTRIRTTCPHCGEVEVGAGDVVLHLVAESLGGGWYGFQCPSCGTPVRKPADSRVARLLIGGGVSVASGDPGMSVHPAVSAPGMTAHPEAPRDGPALTYDDLLDLHLLLESDDWFLELLSGTR